MADNCDAVARRARRDALELMLIGVPDDDAASAAGLSKSAAPGLRRALNAMWALARDHAAHQEAKP